MTANWENRWTQREPVNYGQEDLDVIYVGQDMRRGIGDLELCMRFTGGEISKKPWIVSEENRIRRIFGNYKKHFNTIQKK